MRRQIIPPTPDALLGVWAKIKRAKQHLDDFDQVGVRFRETNSDLIGRKEKLDIAKRAYYFTKEPVTSDYAVWVGDVLHNLRSAIDHLAFALCVAGPGGRAAAEANKRQIHFPVTNGDSNAYKADKTRGLVIALAKPGVKDLLDETEPYKGGKGDALRQLGVLNNADKHRLLVTVALHNPRPNMTSYIKNDPNWTEISLYDVNTGPLKAGDEIMLEPLTTKPHEDLEFAFGVALNEPEIGPMQPLQPLLPHIAEYVERIIPAFNRYV